jgi:hypothetical protein
VHEASLLLRALVASPGAIGALQLTHLMAAVHLNYCVSLVI